MVPGSPGPPPRRWPDSLRSDFSACRFPLVPYLRSLLFAWAFCGFAFNYPQLIGTSVGDKPARFAGCGHGGWAVQRKCLGTGIRGDVIAPLGANDGRVDEQRGYVTHFDTLDPQIIDIHEYIRAGLQLGIDAGCGI